MHSRNRMKKRRRNVTINKRLIAIAAFLIAATSVEVFLFVPRLGYPVPFMGIWRVVLTAVLAMCLARGKPLTRFIVAGVAGAAGIWGILQTAYQMLASSTSPTFSFSLFLGMFVLSIGNLIAAWQLIYSDAIKREFQRSAHWDRKRALSH